MGVERRCKAYRRKACSRKAYRCFKLLGENGRSRLGPVAGGYVAGGYVALGSKDSIQRAERDRWDRGCEMAKVSCREQLHGE